MRQVKKPVSLKERRKRDKFPLKAIKAVIISWIWMVVGMWALLSSPILPGLIAIVCGIMAFRAYWGIFTLHNN